MIDLTPHERLLNARALLSAVHDHIDDAAGNLPDLEAHAARELRGDVAETIRRLSNLIHFTKAKERQGRPGRLRSGNLPEHDRPADVRDLVGEAVGP